MSGSMLGDPVPELRRAVRQVDQVDSAEHFTAAAYHDVEDEQPSGLLRQPLAVPGVEMSEVVVATVGNRGREVGPVRQLELTKSRGMVEAQTFELGHAAPC